MIKRSRASDRTIMRLYRAVAKYVEEAEGKVVVAGGVQIITWPGDASRNFVVGIKCTGRKPPHGE